MVTGRKMRLSRKSCAIVCSSNEILSVWFILLMTNKPIYRQKICIQIIWFPRYCDADMKAIRSIWMSKHQDCNLKSKEQNKPREKKRRYLIRHKLQNTCSEEGLSAPLQVQINQPIFLQGC